MRVKTADKIRAFIRVRLPEAVKNVRAAEETGEAVDLESAWDEETRTLLVSYDSKAKEVIITGEWG